jgi:hypothetical protein
VPVLKHLFGTTHKNTLPLELLIFMQPSMINSRDPFNHPNQIEAHRRQIMDETLRFSMPREPVPRALPLGTYQAKAC